MYILLGVSIVLYLMSAAYILIYPEKLFDQDNRCVLQFIEWYEYPLAVIVLPAVYLVAAQIDRIEVRREKRDKIKKLIIGDTNEQL